MSIHILIVVCSIFINGVTSQSTTITNGIVSVTLDGNGSLQKATPPGAQDSDAYTFSSSSWSVVLSAFNDTSLHDLQTILSPEQNCTLKSSHNTTLSATYTYSCIALVGTPRPSPTPAGHCPSILQNNTVLADWRQKDNARPYRSEVVPKYSDCCNICNMDGNCDAWSFQFGNHVCHLTSRGVPSKLNGVISGYRVPPPPPAPLEVQIDVSYYLTQGVSFIQKQINISVPKEKKILKHYDPSFTIRSIRFWNGMILDRGFQDKGMILKNPQDDFHPRPQNTIKPCTEACQIASLFRRSNAEEGGIIVTIKNPYGNYTGSDTGVFARYDPDFLFSPGYRASDMPGGDFREFIAEESACISACCEDPRCVGYVHCIAPRNFSVCIDGQQCCYLKKKLTQVKPARELKDLKSGYVKGRNPSPSPLPPSPIFPPPEPNSLNLGEWRDFQSIIEYFLMDGADRKPVNVQVGWDTNDYQIDVSKNSGWEEYKRLLTVAGEMGVTHTIFGPRNSKESTVLNHTDAWGWEEVLWLSLGEKIRSGEWLPQRGDEVPSEIQDIVLFAEQQGIKLLAYAYPTLPITGPGAFPIDGEGWLYNKTFHPSPRQISSNLAASLADPMYQDYLSSLLISFVNVTGIGGYAWDYGINGDYRQPSTYAEWRGWMKILKNLRVAYPDLVMDHRQTNHKWGPWYQPAGSYAEPIAGDENPESYGAAGQGAVPTLSTDHVLADNLRRVNFVYRQRQLISNQRVPGFMFHQSERSNNSNWSDPYSGHLVLDKDWHLRDFDWHGYRYSVISSIGTAPLNNVLAMLPGRDEETYEKFPASDKKWVHEWLEFSRDNSDILKRMQPLIALDRGGDDGGKPDVFSIDGTGAFSDDASSGFLFLYSPGPTRLNKILTLDESVGIYSKNENNSWIVYEIYPSKNPRPMGIWKYKQSMIVSPRPTQAQVLRFVKLENSSSLPIAIDLSYEDITISANEISIDQVVGDAGSTIYPVIITKMRLNTSVSLVINGKKQGVFLSNSCVECDIPAFSKDTCSCINFSLKFPGDPLYEMMPVTNEEVPLDYEFWFNSTFSIPNQMWSQRLMRQNQYNMTWSASDMDAAWLGNRLLIYPYILQITNDTRVSLLIDGAEVPLTRAYNSRGHIVERCFQGYYFNATDWVQHNIGQKEIHTISLYASLNATAGQRLVGLYWQGPQDLIVPL
eukprot:UC4_evm2s507